MLLGGIQTEMSEDDSLTKPVTIVHGKNIVIDRRPFAELAPASSPPASSPPASSPALIARNQRLELRFRKALKKNDATMLKRSLELGYVPSDRQWVNIIARLHVRSALSCIDLARTLSTNCMSAAIRRQHKQLFKEVVNRVDVIPPSQMDVLMDVPAYYLEICLNRGLDPNVKLKNARLPLEHACAHSRIGHVEILLNDVRLFTTVTQSITNFLLHKKRLS